MHHLRARKRYIVFIPFLLILAFYLYSKTPQAALQRFYSYNEGEDMLMDPLILAGDPVVPLVMEAVRDKEIPRRRYAIAFLGNGSYRQALPVLEAILQDPADDEISRGEALRSIYQIDPSMGLRYAKHFRGRKDYIGQMAELILTRDYYVEYRRTYQDAV